MQHIGEKAGQKTMGFQLTFQNCQSIMALSNVVCCPSGCCVGECLPQILQRKG